MAIVFMIARLHESKYIYQQVAMYTYFHVNIYLCIYDNYILGKRGGRIEADYDKKIAVFQLHPHHIPVIAPHATSPTQQPCFARLEIPKQGPGIDLHTA